MRSKSLGQVVKETPHKDGYYSVMDFDLKTGKSKFSRYEKITFMDNVDSFLTDHTFIPPFIVGILFWTSYSLFSVNLILALLILDISILGFYLVIFRGGIVF